VGQIGHPGGKPLKVSGDELLHVHPEQGPIQIKQNRPDLIKRKISLNTDSVAPCKFHFITISREGLGKPTGSPLDKQAIFLNLVRMTL
jgi:hypothetical protein